MQRHDGAGKNEHARSAAVIRSSSGIDAHKSQALWCRLSP